MNRNLLILILSLFSINICADEVSLYTWESYFSPNVITQFEKETGHTIKQVYFESEMVRDAVIFSGKADIYDLMILDNHSVNKFSSQGLLNKFEKQTFSAETYFSADALQACGEYGIPYAYGSIGIGYRRSKVSDEFNSWMDLFNYAKKRPDSVVLLNEDIDTLAVALMALGYHPLSENESDLRQAYVLLKDTMDSLLAFRSSSGYAQESGANSKMDVGVIYSGETAAIVNATGDKDWHYTIPNEGTLIWYDCLVSDKSKPMNPATIEFVKFINRADIAAKNAQDIWFATPNKMALKEVGVNYLADEELFPKKPLDENKFFYNHISDKALTLRSNIIRVLSKK